MLIRYFRLIIPKSWLRSYTILHNYRPQRSWAKVMFLQACVCPQRGVSTSVHAGIPPQTRHPPGADTHPPGADTHTPRPGTPPDQTHNPPEQTPPHRTRHSPLGADPPDQAPPPRGKQTAAYG